MRIPETLALAMNDRLPVRIIKLEERFWRVFTVTGTLDCEEQDELLAFLNEMRLPYQKHRGGVGIAGTISPECVDECLSLFYDGRAEVHLSIPLNKK
jgi:hypothetical protein